MTIRHIKAKIVSTQANAPEETIKASNDIDTTAENNPEVTTGSPSVVRRWISLFSEMER